eukprot:2420690-Pyramimonas_sp.AAC.1
MYYKATGDTSYGKALPLVVPARRTMRLLLRGAQLEHARWRELARVLLETRADPPRSWCIGIYVWRR